MVVKIVKNMNGWMQCSVCWLFYIKYYEMLLKKKLKKNMKYDRSSKSKDSSQNPANMLIF